MRTQHSSESPVGLIGFGRFGRAFADLLGDARVEVAAWDPTAEIPSPLAAASASEVVARSSIVVLATPIDSFAGALDALAPHLTPDHLVLDVGSVKVRPAAEMAAALGDRVPWVATHPLFGPMNVARGDRALRAIVCPNDRHPGSVATARALYERIGCEVIEQAPEEHDRLMARTHAMAFFVAKGLIDMGIDDDLPFAPPSFQALAQTIETVRSDAGHLFLAIQRDNPEAAAARTALMNALSQAHDEIARTPRGAPAGTLTIEEHTGDPSPDLIETRDLIDDLDREIIRLLARRAHLAGRAGTIKARRSRPVRDVAREQALIADRREWAADLGLSEDAITDVFDAILRFSRDAQT